MMRLSEKNIKFVKRHEKNGCIYMYYVGMKSNRVSDGRLFYAISNEQLPKAVQNFMSKHDEEIFETIDEEFITYIFRA